MIFLKHLSQWSVPTVLETISKAGVMLICANQLPKADFGILTLAMFIYSFHSFLHFGVIDGLILKLPEFFIKSRDAKIIESLSLSLTYISILLFILLCSGFLYWSAITLPYINTMPYIFLTAFPYQLYNHYLLLNRYTYHFEVTFLARSIVVLLRNSNPAYICLV